MILNHAQCFGTSIIIGISRTILTGRVGVGYELMLSRCCYDQSVGNRPKVSMVDRNSETWVLTGITEVG